MDLIGNDDMEELAGGDVFIIGETKDEYFDQVVGHIEDIILSEQFVALQDDFLETYWKEFDSSEENKLIYTDIYAEYINKFERFLVAELDCRMVNFSMQRFADELAKNGTDCAGEIFELLHSFDSFQTFKELMLDYRSKKEGHTQHLDPILITTPLTYAMDLNPRE